MKKNILPILYFLIGFCVMLEIMARVDDLYKYDANPFTPYTKSNTLELQDEEFGLIGKPYGKFEKWKLNSLGFRGKEVDLNKKTSFRILCLGASETFGLYEKEGNEWPSQLGNLFVQKNIEVAILNSAFYGTSLNNIISRSEKLILELKPDLAILYGGFLYYYTKPVSKQNKITKKTKPKKTPITITDHIRAFAKIKHGVKVMLPEWLQQKYERYDLEKKLRSARISHNITTLLDGVDKDSTVRLENKLKKFTETFRKHRIPLILSSFVLNKSKLDVLGLNRYCPQFSRKGLLELSNTYNKTIKSISKKENIGFVDTASLIPVKRDLHHEYLMDARHFSDKGAAFLAKSFFEEIYSNYKNYNIKVK